MKATVTNHLHATFVTTVHTQTQYAATQKQHEHDGTLDDVKAKSNCR